MWWRLNVLVLSIVVIIIIIKYSTIWRRERSSVANIHPIFTFFLTPSDGLSCFSLKIS